MSGPWFTLLVYGLHATFWAPFILRGRIDKRAGTQQTGPEAHASTGASALVWLHGAAFGVTYFGIGWGVSGGTLWPLPDALRLLGVPIVLLTTWMIVRVMMVFRSWRLRAALQADHQLCTEGPFRVVRHPIYTGMVLLTVASFLLVPNIGTALGMLTNFLAGDLRARAEEDLLTRVFGDRYVQYSAGTKRFVPGIY